MESTTHSFIVKIWLEETVEETGKAKWRGSITHVTEGKRLYMKNLDEIHYFIAPYLNLMGVKFKYGLRLKRCLITNKQ